MALTCLNCGNAGVLCNCTDESEMYEDVETFHIYIWPDDTWVLAEDYDEQEYSFMSDDFAIEELGGDWTEEDIETFVINFNKR
jgi:hypothetical protein